MPIELCQERKRKLTVSSMELPKDSAWHSLKGPFREALKRRALPPRLRFVSKLPLGELTPSAERRSLSLALEPAVAPCTHRSSRNGAGTFI